MIQTSFRGFGDAKTGSTATRKLQSALKTSGYSLVVDGTYGAKTRTALNQFQAKNQLSVMEYPSIETMERLGIPPADWPAIVADSGAPANLVAVAQRAAAAEAVEPTAPVPSTLTPASEELPPAVLLPTTAAAVGIGLGPWFAKNWKWFAIGGGVGAVGLTAILLTTRKRAAATMPAMSDARDPASVHAQVLRVKLDTARKMIKLHEYDEITNLLRAAAREVNQLRWHQRRDQTARRKSAAMGDVSQPLRMHKGEVRLAIKAAQACLNTESVTDCDKASYALKHAVREALQIGWHTATHTP